MPTLEFIGGPLEGETEETAIIPLEIRKLCEWKPVWFVYRQISNTLNYVFLREEELPDGYFGRATGE